MKDPNDKTTRDLIDKPRRGRPPTGKAKTQAQIQRAYRKRLTAEGTRPVLLTAAERAFIVDITNDSRYLDDSPLIEALIRKLVDPTVS